jgi:endonuclease/exonuclease/phosphatase family metal-dependent hydrolase
VVGFCLCLTGVQAWSLLTYNVGGNGATDWSTNAPQVRAIGRQLLYLQPDILALQEIPFPQSDEMTNFVKAYLPGFALARSSGTDGYTRSVIASRFPIRREQRWLDGVTLTNFGYAGTFTRDLFEAEILVPGWTASLHVFTVHLKARDDADSLARRAAEASAVSNFLVRDFRPTFPGRPYVLAGDLNEDVQRPPVGSLQPVRRLLGSATGLRLTTPVNPITQDDRTLSIRTGLRVRTDYILPDPQLLSLLRTSLVFRTDLLFPPPEPLVNSDSQTASDHLPVLMIFGNPPDDPFAVTRVRVDAAGLSMTWAAVPGWQYVVERSADLKIWQELTSPLTATGQSLSLATAPTAPCQFYRVFRKP